MAVETYATAQARGFQRLDNLVQQNPPVMRAAASRVRFAAADLICASEKAAALPRKPPPNLPFSQPAFPPRSETV